MSTVARGTATEPAETTAADAQRAEDAAALEAGVQETVDAVAAEAGTTTEGTEGEGDASAADPTFDVSAFAEQFSSEDGLAPETIEYVSALAKNGFGLDDDQAKGLIYQFAQGLQAQRTLSRQEIFEPVGGEAKYNELTQWAAESLPPEEVEAFNAEIAKATEVGQYHTAIASLQQKYEKRYGKSPSRVGGETPPTPAITPITNRAQLLALQQRPEYRTDPAFRAKVQQRLQAGLDSGKYDQRAT